jgi:tRNA dimethylallyltransferase
MLYFRALQHGLAKLPEANSDIRRKLDERGRNLGWPAMHARLQEIDPVAAARIHPNDPQRIQRALEVYEISGKSLTEHWQVSPHCDLPFRMINLILAPASRSELHERIKTRFIGMLDRGLIDEVRSMVERGDLNSSKPAIRAVGYRQVWSYLHSEFDKNTMVERGIIATRQLAKRQMTWLRKEASPYIYRSGDANLQNLIMRDLEPFVL